MNKYSNFELTESQQNIISGGGPIKRWVMDLLCWMDCCQCGDTPGGGGGGSW